MSRFVDDMPIGRKLFFLALIYSVPIVFLLYLFVSQTNKDINFADKELRGTEYLRVTRKLLEHVPQHRALLAEQIGGNTAVRSAVLRELNASPGTVVDASGDRLTIGAGTSGIAILEIQAEGKRPMAPREFLAGHRVAPGSRFSSLP